MSKNTKNAKKETKPSGGSQRAAQILFAMFAVLIILSMVLSATVTY